MKGGKEETGREREKYNTKTDWAKKERKSRFGVFWVFQSFEKITGFLSQFFLGCWNYSIDHLKSFFLLFEFFV